MINEDNWEHSRHRNKIYFYKWSKYYVCLYPPIKKLEKSKNVNQLSLVNAQNIILIEPFLLKGYNVFSPNNYSSLKQ